MTGAEDHLAEVVETLLERLRELDGDELAERIATRDPALADRLLAGIVLVGEALAQVFSDDAPPPAAPASTRVRITVHDDDATVADETAG